MYSSMIILDVTSPSRWNKVRLRSKPMTSVGGQSVESEGSRRNQLSQVAFLGLGISVRLQCAHIQAAPGYAYDYFIAEILDEGTISELTRSVFDKIIFWRECWLTRVTGNESKCHDARITKSHSSYRILAYSNWGHI